MFFQKLENLSRDEEYKKFFPIIDALDTWLAFLPNSYHDRIFPNAFAKLEGLPLNYTMILFEKLLNIKLLRKKYIIRCANLGECKHVIFMSHKVEEITAYIIKHNDEEFVCNLCDQFTKLSTDNVYIMYELIDLPNKAGTSKKKDAFGFTNIDCEPQNLTASILEKPERYKQQLKEGLKEVVPGTVKDRIRYLLED